MIRVENEENTYMTWIKGVDAHWPEFEWYLTHDGTIDETQKPPYLGKNREEQKKTEEVVKEEQLKTEEVVKEEE